MAHSRLGLSSEFIAFGAHMKKAVCFIDDDADELHRFREFMKEHYIVGVGTTLDKALDELEAHRVKKPDLFLLDLYYGPHTNEEKRAEIAALDNQLSGLEARMRALLIESGQSPQGGFDRAAEVHKRFPGIPRVFFSRKAFLEDALRAQNEGLPLLEKPDPDAQDIGVTEKDRKDAAFERHAEQIKGFLDGRINLNTWWVRNRQKVESFATGFFFFFVKIVWDLFKGNTNATEVFIWVGLLVVACYALFFRN
jgi:hypothetical protein